MPTYEYACDSCEETFEKRMPMSQSDTPQNCPNCNQGPARPLITGGVGFILSGDDWAGKNIKIKGQMEQKNKRLEAKQNAFKKEAPGITLAPNVGGERVDSWSDAAKLAASQGKNTAGYEALAKKEIKNG